MNGDAISEEKTRHNGNVKETSSFKLEHKNAELTTTDQLYKHLHTISLQPNKVKSFCLTQSRSDATSIIKRLISFAKTVFLADHCWFVRLLDQLASECEEYRKAIILEFDSIIDTFTPTSAMLNNCPYVYLRNALNTWNSLESFHKKLLSNCDNEEIPRFLIKPNFGDALDSPSSLLKLIESDRSRHKQSRLAYWQLEHQIEQKHYIDLAYPSLPTSLIMEKSRKNCKNFCKKNYPDAFVDSNSIPKRPKISQQHEKEKSFSIISLEKLFGRSSFLSHEGEKMAVRRLAKRYCFYDDLRYYKQPYVRYYWKDDDGRNLKNYSFARDALGAFSYSLHHSTSSPSSSTNNKHLSQQQKMPKFYRERALRYRQCSHAYKSFKTRKTGYSKSISPLTRNHSNHATIVLTGKMHLSLLLAWCMHSGLNEIVDIENVYAIDDNGGRFDEAWLSKHLRVPKPT